MAAPDGFLQNLIREKPDIVGRTIYLAPRLLPEIPCFLKSDGSIAAVRNPDQGFFRAIDLVRDVFGDSMGRVSASRDLFLQCGRRKSLRNLLRSRSVAETEKSNNRKNKSKPFGNRKKCDGFKIESPVARKALENSEMWMRKELVENGPKYQSSTCSKMTNGAFLCTQCKLKRKAAVAYLKSQKRKRLLCPGIERQRFENLIAVRRWETDRRECSMVTFYDKRLFSLKCQGQISVGQTKCEQCKKTASTLTSLDYRYRRRLQNPLSTADVATEERRLLHSGLAFLSPTDLEKKKQILQSREQETIKALRKRVKKAEKEAAKKDRVVEKLNKLQKRVENLKKSKQRLEEFRPRSWINEAAVRSIVKYLNEETRRVMNPVCQWKLESGETCDFRATTCGLLLQHASTIHMRPQFELQMAKEIGDRRYKCEWLGCENRTPFRYRLMYYRHVVAHTGTISSENRLKTLREQLINAGQAPTGPRLTSLP